MPIWCYWWLISFYISIYFHGEKIYRQKNETNGPLYLIACNWDLCCLLVVVFVASIFGCWFKYFSLERTWMATWESIIVMPVQVFYDSLTAQQCFHVSENRFWPMSNEFTIFLTSTCPLFVPNCWYDFSRYWFKNLAINVFQEVTRSNFLILSYNFSFERYWNVHLEWGQDLSFLKKR